MSLLQSSFFVAFFTHHNLSQGSLTFARWFLFICSNNPHWVFFFFFSPQTNQTLLLDSTGHVSVTWRVNCCFVPSSLWLHISQAAFQKQSITSAWCCQVAQIVFISSFPLNLCASIVAEKEVNRFVTCPVFVCFLKKIYWWLCGAVEPESAHCFILNIDRMHYAVLLPTSCLIPCCRWKHKHWLECLLLALSTLWRRWRSCWILGVSYSPNRTGYMNGFGDGDL